MALGSAFTGAGIAVETPPREPVQGGLFGASNVLPLPPHGELGLFYDTDGIYAAAVAKVEEASDATCLEVTQALPDGFDQVHGTPVVVHAAVECTGFGAKLDDFAAAARARLIAGEERALEEFVWTTMLPAMADDITPAGGAQKAKRAVGSLNTHAGRVYTYVPTLHFGRDLAADLADHFLVKFDEQKAAAIGGSRAVNGAGYFDKTGPGAVEAGAGEEWAYITGQTTIWQSEIDVHEAFDTTTNKMFAVAVRRDVIAIDGFAAAARVTLDQ